MIFFILFMFLLFVVERERFECQNNLQKVAALATINNCGDEYAHLNVTAVNEKLNAANQTISHMEVALFVILTLVVLELSILNYGKRRIN